MTQSRPLPLRVPCRRSYPVPIRRLLVIAATPMLIACAKPKEALVPADLPFTITATDSGATLPDTLYAGLNHFVFENRGSDIHECMFIRLPEGMDSADFVAQVASGVDFPEGAIDCSGPGLTSPGQRVEMWVPLEEGNYMTGCWFRNHMATHPQRTFVVRGAPATPVVAPRESATVRMVDFRYEITGRIARGAQVIRFQTGGPSMHEADVIRLDDGRTLDDVRAWMLGNQQGPAPGTAIGGALDSHDLGVVVWVRYDFIPAHYVLWCDMPMIQTSEANAPHVTHAEAGMFKDVVVE